MKKFCRLLAMALWLFAFQELHAQDKTISGAVLADDDGTPLPGVTVTNQVTKKSTSTNNAGYYSIKASKGQILVFSYIGFVKKEMTVSEQASISIRMISNDKEMDQVVVTGYGQNKNKRELAYQAPVVSGEEIAQTRRTNFLNSLAGRVPGLTVTSTSGMPGASAQIMLRGGTSIGGNNQPLFVVDGMPMTDASVDQNELGASASITTTASGSGNLALANRNSDYTNRISDMNPDDIENVTILKGPEATAIYGSDGAGGAIVITTKKGGTGKTKISYTNAFVLAEVYRFPKVQTKYSRGTNGVYDPTSYNVYGYNFFGPEYAEGTILYDNIRNFFKKSLTQLHNVSAEAGTKDLNYRVSAGYLNSDGVVPNTSLKRYNFRFAGFAQLNKRIKLNTTISYTNSDNDKATKSSGSFYTNLMTYPADIDARNYINPDGTRRILRTVSLASELNSPFWDVNKNKSNDKTNNFTGNLNLTANIVKGLTATGIFGINNISQMGSMLYHPYSREGYTLGGYISTYEQIYNSQNGTFRLNYNKSIAGKFSNSLYAGAFFENNRSVINSQRGERFYELNFESLNNTDPTARVASIQQRETRKTRFYAGYTFGYDNLAYVSVTGTREGVSTLTSKYNNSQPFFNYGSVSGSFILSDLDFMESTKSWLSYAKFRASYATTGKGPLSPYVIDYSFGSVQSTGGGYALGVTGNNFNLKPEFSQNSEFGGEFKFLKNRIGIDIAYFNNKIKDNIIANRISYVSGYILRYFNGGKLSSKGVEIQLTGSPVKSKHFSWDVVVNFDKAKSKVLALPGDLPIYYDSETLLFGAVRSSAAVGQSLGNLSGNTYEKNKNGDLLISPTSGFPVPNLTELVSIGDRQPDYKMGIINTFNYKSFTLSCNIDIRKGGDVYNANEFMMMINGASVNTLDREQSRVITGVLKDGLENSKTPSRNTIAINPYFRSNYYNGILTESDFIENVNWLRMRDITLGYQVSSKVIKRQKVFTAANIAFTATDLFMITNYSGMDPNVNSLNSSNTKGYGGAGIDYGSIPTPRAMSVGVQLTF